MDKWTVIEQQLKQERDNFSRSFKCVYRNTTVKIKTVKKHLIILVDSLEKVRTIVRVYNTKLTKDHDNFARSVYWELRDKLLKVYSKYNIEEDIPHCLDNPIRIDINKLFVAELSELKELVVLPPISENITDTVMSQTMIEFLNTAAKLIPEFDGKAENLRTFIDALRLVQSLMSSHEATAVNLIKTKLKGTARNLITNELTVEAIIQKLQSSVKGESTEVINAKMMNVRQNSKSANAYTKEIEELTKSLENAYISDGCTPELASKYATQTAVKAMTKNCTIDKVKLIMEAGQFNTLDEAVSKFVNSCTESTGSTNTILFTRNRGYRGSRGYYRGRGNFRRDNTNYNNNGNNFNRRYNNNYRSRGVSNSFNNRNNDGRNVRMTLTENEVTPDSQ
ncbi:uncharacterized protein LOC119665468 [Teleopsis dalmanni]|uniref:uncharacterized protein LOC119665468 n=1 Tax=Teleopsis dalmanni TaxID=139649 RepID=UPI0018CE5A4E|nr:uncharacterized protein LOC119665468 [Teleopsis dalmanni]